MKKRVGLIGNFGDGCQIGGQITKTNEVLRFLQTNNYEINLLNVYNNNYFHIFLNFIKTMHNSDNVIIILASTGYFKILPLIVILKRIFNCKIHEVVIGGVRHEYIKKKKIRFILEKEIDYIYLETTNLVREYIKMGIDNVIYLPNYKSFETINIKEKYHELEIVKICTFSRIDENKGIDTAIKIVELLNTDDHKRFRLDIYGPISESYKLEFDMMLKNTNKHYICYKGIVKTDEAQMCLLEYDMLLFPTHWRTEGFPGTFIDALSAGLPIIASDKENFKDIIIDRINGYLINEYDINKFCEVIKMIADDRELYYKLKDNAVKMAEKYKTENVLSALKI